jgi:uncharacterized protein YidB (DUF937 family)
VEKLAMGLFDQLSGSLKGVIASELANNAPAFINAALAKTNMGDLEGLVAQLQQSGLDEQVRSWLGNGPNLQITPEQVESALGNEKLQQLAAQFGIPLDTVSKLLAEHLPKAVDQASPEGTIQSV